MSRIRQHCIAAPCSFGAMPSVGGGGTPVTPPPALPLADALMEPASAAGEPIEFVHIGKNAGGSIETTGARLGLHWGQQRLWPELS